MTGPGEPTQPEDANEPRPPEGTSRPEDERPAPTGWPGRPDPARFGGATPGSVLPVGSGGGAPRPESFRVPPSGQPTGWTSAAPARPVPTAAPVAGSDPAGSRPPVRPPVPSGVPPRPTPLPPPRATGPTGEAGPDAGSGAVAGSLAAASTTVIPEGVRRPTPRPSVSRAPAPRGRRAKLAVKRLDPWSVFVNSLVLSLLLGVVTIIAAFVLYAALSALGVPHSINTNIGDITKNDHILTQGTFVGIAALIAAANVVLLTALATIGSMLYNLVATFTGGLELTLSERD